MRIARPRARVIVKPLEIADTAGARLSMPVGLNNKREIIKKDCNSFCRLLTAQESRSSVKKFLWWPHLIHVTPSCEKYQKQREDFGATFK